MARIGAITSVQVFDNLSAAKPFWRHLEAGRALASPYQRFDLLAAWQHHVGDADGTTPFIVVGFGPGDEPLFLWPFGRNRRGPLNIVKFLGSKHANFNIGLWRRDLAASFRPQDFHDIFHRIASEGEQVDLLALYRQPFSWDGLANPFALLPHQSSIDQCLGVTLDRPGEELVRRLLTPSMRRRLGSKIRKLNKLPGYRYVLAEDAADIDRLLDAFFEMKAIHMAQHGLRNVFAAPGVTEFLRGACHRKLPNGRRLIEIHALETDNEVLAIFAVTADEHHGTSMFNTYTLGENARHSPGLILIREIITDCADRGLHGFDLGVGKAEYKLVFCNEIEPLFDTFIGLTTIGRIAAPAFSAVNAAKRLIKEKPALWAAVHAAQRLRARPQ